MEKFRNNQLVCKLCGVTAVMKKGKLVHRHGGHRRIVTCGQAIVETVLRTEWNPTNG